MITIDKLELKLKGNGILRPIDLSISKGEIVCLAGRNGAGKTSLLKCICGLENRFIGDVLYKGIQVRNKVPLDVGILIGGPSLYSYLSATQNIDIFRKYYGLPKSVVETTLKLIGLEAEGGKLVKNFSAGMKQRLAIGIAFINTPSLIILDEPLNALDPEAIVGVRELILNINSNFQTTFIISSHSLEEINKLFSRLLIMKNGKIVLNETKETLKNFRSISASIESSESEVLTSEILTSKLFYSYENLKLKVYGNKEVLDDFKTTFREFNWTECDKVSIEEIYLASYLGNL